MHVVHLVDVLPPGIGGIESALATLLNLMPDVRFTVVTPRHSGGQGYPWGSHVNVYELDAGDLVQRLVSPVLPARLRPASSLMAQLVHEVSRRRLAASMDADLVHMHSFPLFRFFANLRDKYPNVVTSYLVERLRAFNRLKRPLTFTDHSLFGGSRRQFESIQSGLLVERLENIVCVERSGKVNVDAYARERGLGIRSWWIPNPIDTERFRPGPLPSSSRLIIGYAGRWEKRGTEEIIGLTRALPDWAELRIALAVRSDEDLRSALSLERPGVKVFVNLPNSSMPEFYNSLHLLLDPWSFGAPRTALEAMSCGRVVVRWFSDETDVNPPEIPPEVSPTVRARGAQELFAHLSSFQDDLLLRGLGDASRALAEATYSSHRIVDAYRAVYGVVTGTPL